MRIASLLPSATEIVCALGLADMLVGVSHECDYPPDVVAELPRLTRSAIPHNLPAAEIDAVVAARLQRGESLYRNRSGGVVWRGRASSGVSFRPVVTAKPPQRAEKRISRAGPRTSRERTLPGTGTW